MGPPPIVKSRTVGRSVHKWPNAPGREGLGSEWGGNLKKCPKCEMTMHFGVFEEGCQKNGELGNGKLAEASHSKGGHVVHMCHPVLTLSGGGGPAPRGPPIYPSTHRSKLW